MSESSKQSGRRTRPRKNLLPLADPEARARPLLASVPDLSRPTASLFDGVGAQHFSCYAGILEPQAGDNPNAQKMLRMIPPNQLWPTRDDRPVPPLGESAHDQLRALILSESYPCVGARAAVAAGTYRFGYYKHMGHLESVAPMGRDLRRFCDEHEQLGNFTTFIAVFRRPQLSSEDDFEMALWEHLQSLHDHDANDWDPLYSPDPKSPKFGFSFHGKAFFVVGMHAAASRFSRRFGFHTLTFNPESQIRRLKLDDSLTNFAEIVRQRDELYQGNINPSLPLDMETTGGEARVYSGKEHRPGDGWQCPFQPRPAVLAKYNAAVVAAAAQPQ